MGSGTARDSSRPRAMKQRRNGTVRWLVIALLTAAIAVLGFVGFTKHFAATGERVSVSSLLYLTLGLVIQKSIDKWLIVPWELDVARFAAQGIALWAVLEGIAAVFRRQLVLLRSRFYRDHTVVCGAGRMGALIASRMAERGAHVIIVDADPSAVSADGAVEWGCVRLVADATDPAALRRARVHRARALVCCADTDGANAEIAVAAESVCEGRAGERLLVSIHVTDSRLWTLLRERELACSSKGTRHEYFNVFDAGARTLLETDTTFAVAGPDDPPHLVVIGLGRLGENLLVNASRDWWSRRGEHARKLRVTVVDASAGIRVAALRNRYPGLEAACEVETLDMDVESAEFERGEFLGIGGRHPATSVFVCFDDDQRALSTALWVRDRSREQGVRVVARMAGEGGLSCLIGERDDGFPSGIESFPLLERVCTPELVERGTRERIARAMHEVYLRGRRAAGDLPERNPSLVPWQQLPESLKHSNRSLADDIPRKLDALGARLVPLDDWTEAPRDLAPKEIELLARREHDRWCEERVAAGWIHDPGPKNTEKKTSPYLVPWEQLDEEVKEIDREMVRALPAVLARAGFRMVRPSDEDPARAV